MTTGSGKVKGSQPIPCLNPDPFKCIVGPKNLGEAIIDEELTTCLLDNGAQLNFVTPIYAVKRGFNVMSLDCLTKDAGGNLPPIRGIGSIMVQPIGFVMVNVKVPCVNGYNEDQIAIVLDDPSMRDCPVILGTPTFYRVMQVIKESEISKLAIPWASSGISWLMQDMYTFVGQYPMPDVANKPVAPASIDEVLKMGRKVFVPPFRYKVTHGRTGLRLIGCKVNVTTHGLETRSK